MEASFSLEPATFLALFTLFRVALQHKKLDSENKLSNPSSGFFLEASFVEDKESGRRIGSSCGGSAKRDQETSLSLPCTHSLPAVVTYGFESFSLLSLRRIEIGLDQKIGDINLSDNGNVMRWLSQCSFLIVSLVLCASADLEWLGEADVVAVQANLES